MLTNKYKFNKMFLKNVKCKPTFEIISTTKYPN